MNNKIILLAAIAGLVLAGCGNSSNSGTTRTRPVNSLKVPSNASPFNSNGQTQTVNPVQQTAATTTQPIQLTPVTTAPTTASKAGLNPAHGQPGHRCDIAVGAPLDSKPVAATTTPTITTSTSPAVSTTTSPLTFSPTTNATEKTFTANPTNASTTSKAGINPAHGQPGHRCDIAVGAPLDSKPTVNSVTTTTANGTSTTSIPAPTPIVTTTETKPAATTGTTTTTTSKAGINPAHGEPGHRCDIAVGAPLDSKPTTPAKVEVKTEEKKN